MNIFHDVACSIELLGTWEITKKRKKYLNVHSHANAACKIIYYLRILCFFNLFPTVFMKLNV